MQLQSSSGLYWTDDDDGDDEHTYRKFCNLKFKFA
jgi:hypothetical protein